MAEPAEDGTHHAYKLVSATYKDKAYPDGVFLVDETRGEIELRQWVGRRKKEQAPVARFRFEPTTEVSVDGPLLKVSELSITLESPAVAAQVAALLRRPAHEREANRVLADSESAVREFLKSRGEVLAFLSRLKADPREALLSAESSWGDDDTKEPIDAVCSSYSSNLALSLERMTSSVTDAERSLGPKVTERLYAVACTIGAIQDSLFEGDPGTAEEQSALRELGIAATALELRSEDAIERLLQRAHHSLLDLASATP